VSAAHEGMEEIVKEFLAESAEGLDLLDRHLIELERDPKQREKLAEIFRAVHTLKGSSGMLGYPKLESVAHAGESLLGALRDEKLALNQPLIGGLLDMVDALRGLLRAIERTGSEGTGDYDRVVCALEDLLLSSPEQPANPRVTQDASADESEKKPAVATIRVNIGLLDRLMDLAGELVLARNQVLRFNGSRNDRASAHAAQQMKRVISDLRDAVMKARLQPIGSIWNKFPRQAHDLALACRKQVTIEMHGSETELDRGILEAIRDPLTHILRNAIAHGIESPEQRRDAGKAPAGHLCLRAFHREGQVHIEISDDGGGIDLERVRQRALQREVITPEQALRMGERELANLVFLPGFSTAETVTNVCGRGVGLDVVRANIEKIGGVVDLESDPGKGTTLHFKIPLTLTIVPALIVGSAGERFAIPQDNVVEVTRLGRASSIEQVCGAPVYRLRDKLLPLCFLDRELRLESSRADELHVVVVETGTSQFGLVVDALQGTEEIVVKPLGAQLDAVACFAGAAVLGDGRVVLVLDVTGLARRAGIAAGTRTRPVDDVVEVNRAGVGMAQKWLIFRGTAGSRFALPLPAVARLEEIPAERIEYSGGREVIQYGGEILPLLRLSELFHEPEQKRKLLPVAVIRDSTTSAVLVIDGIEDIVEETVEVRREGSTELLEGRAVIRQRVADVLNLKNVLARGEAHGSARAAGGDI
jgi:two-component system, chemotaxis family, sensor kinase CheA